MVNVTGLMKDEGTNVCQCYTVCYVHMYKLSEYMEFIQISSLLSIQMSEKISQMLTHFRSRFHVSCVFTVLPSSHTNTYAYLNTNTSSFYKNVDTNCFFETFLVTFFFGEQKFIEKVNICEKKNNNVNNKNCDK